jgi:DNA-binding MarR family transcriptional regulator
LSDPNADLGLAHSFDKTDAFLSITESKILLTMNFIERTVYSREILDVIGIPQSTWSDILLHFLKAGLVTRELRREYRDGRIKYFALFSLTQKGKVVAENLWKIYATLSRRLPESSSKRRVAETTATEAEGSSLAADFCSANKEKEIDKLVLSCIERGLAFFGEKTENTVRTELALTYNLEWKEVPKNIESLSRCLRKRFGPQPANAMETIILQEFQNKFGSALLEVDWKHENLISLNRKLRSTSHYEPARLDGLDTVE